MATAAKVYVVEDAEERSDPKTARTPFPGTLAGLLDALGAARYRSAAMRAEIERRAEATRPGLRWIAGFVLPGVLAPDS